jgi:hypothetical protein
VSDSGGFRGSLLGRLLAGLGAAERIEELPRSTSSDTTLPGVAERRIDALLDAVRERAARDPHPYLLFWDEAHVRELPAAREIRASAPEEQVEVVIAACARTPGRGVQLGDRARAQIAVLEHVLRGLLRRKLPFDDARMGRLLAELTRLGRAAPISFGLLPGLLERFLAQGGSPQTLREHAALLRALGRHGPEADRLRRRLDALLAEGPVVTEPASGEPWSDLWLAELRAMPEPERSAWSALLAHAQEEATAARPSARWRAEAARRVAALGGAGFAAVFTRWTEAVVCPKQLARREAIATANADLLRGLVWCCAEPETPEVDAALEGLAEQAYKKIPGVGPFARRIGNACIQVLGERGGPEAMAALQRLAQRLKYGDARTLVARTLERAAARAGLTRDELEDRSVPDFGFDAAGVARARFGECEAVLRLAGASEVSLSWAAADGKPRASVPQAVKVAFPTAAREMRARARLVGDTLRAQRDRLEATLLGGRTFRLDEWRARWLAHPLLGRLAASLLWTIDPDGRRVVVSVVGGALRDLDDHEPAGLPGDRGVRLWHPLEAELDAILAWRRRLAALGVTQPFKQAHREVYLLTPPERLTRTYSNRFAAHVLKQHQLAALCRERGWRYHLQGNFDGGNAPHRLLPNGWVAEFHVEPVPEPVTEAGISLYVTSDRVTICEPSGEPIPLADVPPLVLSEVMREVDLFVGVASVGNDPTWADGGEDRFHAYWREYAFGDLSATAQTRRAVLADLLPALRIADRCRLDERFLEVEGRLARYRIHLGSANVQMEPGSRYLCIVPAPARREDQAAVALPFEGDRTLSLILSKAFLLAADEAIEDPSILRQITR